MALDIFYGPGRDDHEGFSKAMEDVRRAERGKTTLPAKRSSAIRVLAV